MNKLIIITLTLFSLVSCNKEKRFSNRLMKGENWLVKEVKIDGQLSQINGNWKIVSDVNIYDSVPSAYWTHGNFDADFVWQFQQKGKELILQYTSTCLECQNDELDTLDFFVDALSGTYKVEKHGLGKMTFESTETKGFSGKKVSIRLLKIKS